MRTVHRLVPLCAAIVASIALASAVVSPARAEDTLWKTDFAAAKAQAKAEHKYLLVDFTGSDWCHWCVQLKKEIFDVPAFQAAASKQFVFVELDFPSKKEQPKDLKAQNSRLGDQYGYRLNGFPTVFVMDAEGQIVTRTGYREGGPEPYVKHLVELIERHESVPKMKAELATAKGLDRAKLLDRMVEAVSRLHNEDGWESSFPNFPAFDHELAHLGSDARKLRLAPLIASRYGVLNETDCLEQAKLLEWTNSTLDRLRAEQEEFDAWCREIPDLDPDNQAGLKAEYQLRNLLVEAARLQIGFDMARFYEAPKLLKRAVELPGLTGEYKQWAYFRQGLLAHHNGNYARAISCFEKSLAAAPDLPATEGIKEYLETDVRQLAERNAEVAKARADLEKAAGPDRIKALSAIIACSYHRDGSFPAAELERYCRELVELDKDNQSGHRDSCVRELRCGSLDYVDLLFQEKFAEAEAACDKALAKPGQSAEDVHATYYWKAVCRQAQDNFQGCLDCIQKSLEADPQGQCVDGLKKLQVHAEKGLKEQKAKL